MKKLDALQTVYSYMFPEVKRAVMDTMMPTLMERIRAEPESNSIVSLLKTDGELLTLIETTFRQDYLSRFLQAPEEMDTMHEPILQKYVDRHSVALPGLAGFQNRYPTAGSEEGIRETLSYLLMQGVEQVYVLKGEYEGYHFVGETRGYNHEGETKQLKTIEIDSNTTNVTDIEPGWFFISNPSARDGNIIPNEFIDEVCEGGHKVFYDLAYVDSTRPHEFDLSHENIRAAVISFSKPYGLFYFRAGAAFTKEPIPSLYGNKWFKVVPSLLVADKLMDSVNPGELYQKYGPVQEGIIKRINDEHGLGMRASDALLLGHLKKEDVGGFSQEQLDLIRPFKRGDDYRFCLKPYYEMLEGDER